MLAASPVFAADGGKSLNVAKCDKAIIGSGPADWRLHSATAGPVGVWKPALGKMWESGGQLYTKMGLLIAGHAAVKVSVPPALRKRVFLYYGRYRDRSGHPTTLFTNAPGFAAIEFQPCVDQPRTIWPGGVRVRGTLAVHLTVTVPGRPPLLLRLGRPHVFQPAQ